jgi:SAM-dependent methyltransferase
MCHSGCILFAATRLSAAEVSGREVLEVGSRDVNGSVRSVVEALGPAGYLGIDIEEGPGVDVICDATELVSRFGRERFDVVISTELLEHVRDWRSVIGGMKAVLRPGGVVLITTRSKGFGVHGYPYDYWRYEPEDMDRIFADFELEAVEPDQLRPGVFVKARKPERHEPVDLDGIRLYSIVKRERVHDVSDSEARSFEPPFSPAAFLWELMPPAVKREGIRPLLRRLLRTWPRAHG